MMHNDESNMYLEDIENSLPFLGLLVGGNKELKIEPVMITDYEITTYFNCNWFWSGMLSGDGRSHSSNHPKEIAIEMMALNGQGAVDPPLIDEGFKYNQNIYMG